MTLVKALNSKSFQITIFYCVTVAWMAFLSISVFQTRTSLSQTQTGIAERIKHRYSAIDAARDNRIQNIRLTNIERKLDVLEAEFKRKKLLIPD